MGFKAKQAVALALVVMVFVFARDRGSSVTREPSAENPATPAPQTLQSRQILAPLPQTAPAPESPEQREADRAAMEAFRAARIAQGQRLRAKLDAAQGPRVPGTPYSLMPGLNALRADSPLYQPQDLIKKIGPMVIVNNANGPRNPDERLTHFDPNDLAVVMNPQNGALGLVTGVLNLVMPDTSLAAQVASDQGLDVAQVFDQTHLVFLKARLGSNLVTALAALQKDPRVSGAELDVLSAAATPR